MNSMNRADEKRKDDTGSRSTEGLEKESQMFSTNQGWRRARECTLLGHSNAWSMYVQFARACVRETCTLDGAMHLCTRL